MSGGRTTHTYDATGVARSSYAAAGVDIDAGDRAVELMRNKVARAGRPEVVGGLGGFAGLFRLDPAKYKEPLLASSTDGVGTKLAIAQALDKHDTVGIDLVGMVVDDLVVCGAEPLFLQDYIACGQVVPERIAEIVGGIAEGCAQAGCALVGGETAEHPGLMGPDHYDIAGTGVGVVEADNVLGPDTVREGDVVIAMASSGLHSNGFSLVRHVLLQGARLRLDAEVDELDRPLGEELLTPTRIYAKDCLSLIEETAVHGFAHITGGGLAANLARVLPPGISAKACLPLMEEPAVPGSPHTPGGGWAATPPGSLPPHLSATVERSSWTPGPVFSLVAGRGRVETAEMERTFNMGVGMVA